MYDYGRRDAQGQTRPLHIEKALEVMRFGEQTGGKVKPARAERGAVTETYLAACPYFVTEKWEFTERVPAATSREHFDLLIFLEGKGGILWNGERERAEYAPAQVWLMPAALGEYHLAPDAPEAPTALLRTHVPVEGNES